MKILLPLLVFFGCAASVSTEQYVGEYEKQKSLDEIEVTKVESLPDDRNAPKSTSHLV